MEDAKFIEACSQLCRGQTPLRMGYKVNRERYAILVACHDAGRQHLARLGSFPLLSAFDIWGVSELPKMREFVPGDISTASKVKIT